MTCAEFQAVLPDFLEGSVSAAQRTHLTICPSCSGLVEDITAISREASFLRASDEPSPRVWASIEIALREEGLIHEPTPELVQTSTQSVRQWMVAWLLPATAAFLLTFGLLRLQHAPVSPTVAAVPATSSAPATSQAATTQADLSEDKQLLEEVGSRSPAMRDSYEKELRHVNEYIRDAEQSAKAHPEDEEAQESLMNAYEQKAMVYELAADRSVP